MTNLFETFKIAWCASGWSKESKNFMKSLDLLLMGLSFYLMTLIVFDLICWLLMKRYICIHFQHMQKSIWMNGIHLSHIFNHFLANCSQRWNIGWVIYHLKYGWMCSVIHGLAVKNWAELWTDLAIASLRNICNSIFMIGANTHCIWQG